MGMFAAIARVFGGQRETGDKQPDQPTVVVDWDKRTSSGGTATTTRRPVSPGSPAGVPRPSGPVRIDLTDRDASTGTPPATPRDPEPAPKPEPTPVTELVKAEEVRNSLRDELRDSYERAISLAERVDRHLDTQEERSRRLLEIAENLPAALESLGSIGAGQAELRSAVTELASAFREGQASTQKGLAMQLESLGRVEGLIAEATDSQREIRASIENLSSAFEEITASNKRLGDTLTDMKRRDSEREERLQAANARTHKLLMGLAIGGGIIGGLGVLALIAQVVVPLFTAG
ncbi:MAG: hypothetical protein ACTS22_06340 [Phycisphaerales bacterium]